MKCNETREVMPDLAAGLTAVTPEVKAHLDSCAECAGKLEAFRQTMSLLDEWQAPEPSPYFDVRLNARLREKRKREAARGLDAVAAQAGAGRVVCPADGGERKPGSDEQRRAVIPLAQRRSPGGVRCKLRRSRARQWEICRHWRKIRICTPISMCSMISKCSRM